MRPTNDDVRRQWPQPSCGRVQLRNTRRDGTSRSCACCKETPGFIAHCVKVIVAPTFTETRVSKSLDLGELARARQHTNHGDGSPFSKMVRPISCAHPKEAGHSGR